MTVFSTSRQDWCVGSVLPMCYYYAQSNLLPGWCHVGLAGYYKMRNNDVFVVKRKKAGVCVF